MRVIKSNGRPVRQIEAGRLKVSPTRMLSFLSDGTILSKSTIEGIELPWNYFGKAARNMDQVLKETGKYNAGLKVKKAGRKVAYLHPEEKLPVISIKKEKPVNKNQQVVVEQVTKKQSVPLSRLTSLSGTEMQEVITFCGKRDFFISRKGYLCQRRFDETDEMYVEIIARPNHRPGLNVGEALLKAFAEANKGK